MEKKEALEIVQKNGLELDNLPAHFKKDKEVVLEALKKSGTLKDRDGKTILISLEDIDESLRNDPDILAIVNKKK